MSTKSRILFLILLSSFCSVGKCQFYKRPFIIEPRIHAGMSVPLYDALAYLIKDEIFAFDIAIYQPSGGKDYWDKLFRYPRTGIGFYGSGLGNNDVFGKAWAVYNFINFPLLRKAKIFSINYQISFGGAYVTKKFDIEANPLNRAIGANANLYLRLGIDGRFKLSPATELIFEAGAAHFSNGKTRSPNYGINMVSSSIGFNYMFNSSRFKKQDPEIPPLLKRNFQSVILSAGPKVYDNLLGNRYLTSTISYNFEHYVSHRRKIGIGGDFFYDGSIKEALASEEGIPEDHFKKLVRIGIHGSYAMRYRDMMMGVQLGHYLYSKYKVLTNVYSRISVQYLITENMFWGASVRAHMGKADGLELGLGYCW